MNVKKSKGTWEQKLMRRRALAKEALEAILKDKNALPVQKLEAVKILREMGEI